MFHLITLLALFICSSVWASPVPSSGVGIYRWNIHSGNGTLLYYIDSSDADFITQTQAAAAEWTAVSTSYLTLTETSDENEADIVVNAASISAGGQAAPISDSTGHIISCTATMNTSSVAIGGDALRGVILHEIGHCFGLQHSVVDEAIMSYRQGTELTDDDRMAITQLYANGSVDLPIGCSTVKITSPPTSGGPPSGGMALLMILMLGGFIWVRRRFTPAAQRVI